MEETFFVEKVVVVIVERGDMWRKERGKDEVEGDGN